MDDRSRHLACCSRFTSARIAGARSIRDGDLARHVLVPAAAEVVAMEREGAGPVRHDSYAGGLAGFDVRVQVQLGDLEAVHTIERSELENGGNTLLQRDLARAVLEALGGDLDHLLPSGI